MLNREIELVVSLPTNQLLNLLTNHLVCLWALKSYKASCVFELPPRSAAVVAVNPPTKISDAAIDHTLSNPTNFCKVWLLKEKNRNHLLLASFTVVVRSSVACEIEAFTCYQRSPGRLSCSRCRQNGSQNGSLRYTLSHGKLRAYELHTMKPGEWPIKKRLNSKVCRQTSSPSEDFSLCRFRAFKKRNSAAGNFSSLRPKDQTISVEF